MENSIVRTVAVTLWTLATLSFLQGATQARLVASTTRGSLQRSLMDPGRWEPAGDLLSTVFVGDSIEWLDAAADSWTLPGGEAQREFVECKGQWRPNHQQFTIKTRDDWRSFHLHLEMKFEDDAQSPTALEQLGNSGVYIYGLYEVQLLDTSRFLPPGPVPSDVLRDGMIHAVVDGRPMQAPANKILCGSIYGGGCSSTEPQTGAAGDRDGQLHNYCKPSGEWNRLDVFFVPPRFAGERKTHEATVGVLINGRRVYYGGRPKYGIPRPTGAQGGKADRDFGPVVIQDHGNRISFRNITIDPGWRPPADWIVAAGR